MLSDPLQIPSWEVAFSHPALAEGTTTVQPLFEHFCTVFDKIDAFSAAAVGAVAAKRPTGRLRLPGPQARQPLQPLRRLHHLPAPQLQRQPLPQLRPQLGNSAAAAAAAAARGAGAGGRCGPPRRAAVRAFRGPPATGNAFERACEVRMGGGRQHTAVGNHRHQD